MSQKKFVKKFLENAKLFLPKMVKKNQKVSQWRTQKWEPPGKFLEDTKVAEFKLFILGSKKSVLMSFAAKPPEGTTHAPPLAGQDFLPQQPVYQVPSPSPAICPEPDTRYRLKRFLIL